MVSCIAFADRHARLVIVAPILPERELFLFNFDETFKPASASEYSDAFAERASAFAETERERERERERETEISVH
jgi:hypothetical protein